MKQYKQKKRITWRNTSNAFVNGLTSFAVKKREQKKSIQVFSKGQNVKTFGCSTVLL